MRATTIDQIRQEQDKKRREEERDSARVYAEFVASLTDDCARGTSRTFVRGGTMTTPGTAPLASASSGELYVLSVSPPSPPQTPPVAAAPDAQLSQLATGGGGKGGRKREMEELRAELSARQESSSMSCASASSATTKLCLENLSPESGEQDLWREFSRFGNVGRVKVVWPRSKEENERGKNTGFVTFLKRRDAEVAYEAVERGITLNGHKLVAEWGRSSEPLPLFPLALVGDPNSGFELREMCGWPLTRDLMLSAARRSQTSHLAPSVVVQIPSDLSEVTAIDLMAQRVVSHGHEFEQIVIERERRVPTAGLRFLFENGTQSAIYYRWRVFSLMQGDTLDSWRIEPFQMFVGGPWWQPPPLPERKTGYVPEGRTKLGAADRVRLISLLSNIKTSRQSVRSVMGFAIDHASAAEDVVCMILQSMSDPSCSTDRLVAKLYAISDILFNCTSTGPATEAPRYHTW